VSAAPGPDAADLPDAPSPPVPSHLSEAPSSAVPSDLSDASSPPVPSDLSEAPSSAAPSDLSEAPAPVTDPLRAGLLAPIFHASVSGPRLRIDTPFALPDGDLLALFVLRHSDPPLLGDLGETLRWLRSHTSAARRSEGQQQRIAEVCGGLGVELQRGELRTHARPGEPLALATVRLAQACLRVAELWRGFRPRPGPALLDEVEACLRAELRARPLSITRGERIAGISATTWSADFRVRTPERQTLVFVLASERRDHARKLAEHVVAACIDLAHLRKLRRTPVQFIALFDDRGAAWSDADARLVAPFAIPCKWSERATWLPLLEAPAPGDEPDLDALDADDEPDARPDAGPEAPADESASDEEAWGDDPDPNPRDDFGGSNDDDEPDLDPASDEPDPTSDLDIASDEPDPPSDPEQDADVWRDEHTADREPDEPVSASALSDPGFRRDDSVLDDTPLSPSPMTSATIADLDLPRLESPPMALHARPATPADYPDFARLFPELGTGDTPPGRDAWVARQAPTTLMHEEDGEVVAYTFYEVMQDLAYVRNVVVDPGFRGRGLGGEVMRRLADHLRALGCTRWCLNVTPSNEPALRLYRGVGMLTAYRSTALRFDWDVVDRLPADDIPLKTCGIAASEEPAIEAAFDLPPGQLAVLRANPARVHLRLSDPANPDDLGLGFASFDPHFPGAYPLRVARPGLAPALLHALRPHARDGDFMQLVVEDDDALTARLLAAGARLRLELVHLRGSLT